MKTALFPLGIVAAIVTLSACTKTPMPVPTEPATKASYHSRLLDTTRQQVQPTPWEVDRKPRQSQY